MNLNNIKVSMKVKKSVGLALSAAILPASLFTFSSCEDYLTITPTSSIVEEEFWQDKNDLNNALFGCYKSMTEASFLDKVIYWGEMRSDNCDRSTELSSSSEEAAIMNANLLSTYYVFNWTPVYRTINYCNKVIAHGPEVVQTDESFSEQNWLPMKAEAQALRALCYFYLVRTFGEIPYITEDINNDSQELCYSQSTQIAVINNIIEDLESAKVYAMSEYGNVVSNKGRITKKAIYAMLADVYLWRASYLQGKCHPFTNRLANEYFSGDNTARTSNPTDDVVSSSTYEEDYKKCIEYCDLIIDLAYSELNKKIKTNYPQLTVYKPTLSDLLAQHEATTDLGKKISKGNAYDEIFGTGNSDESIFELQFDGTSYGNTMITDIYWNLHDGKVAKLTAPKALFAEVASTPNSEILDAVFTKTDYRRWEALNRLEDGQTVFDYSKGIIRTFTQKNDKKTMMTDNTQSMSSGNLRYSFEYSQRTESNLDANFIVYRLSEIFLMKAEAMSQICTEEKDLSTAFNYVREVFKRSNPYAYEKANNTANSDTLKAKTFASQRSLEYLVMAERQREFLCEGKRWFDLVRFAQRRGSTDDMLSLLTRKFTSGQKAVQAKLADMQSLFCPVWDDELKVNSKLYQNGVWKTSKTTGRTDNQK